MVEEELGKEKDAQRVIESLSGQVFNYASGYDTVVTVNTSTGVDSRGHYVELVVRAYYDGKEGES